MRAFAGLKEGRAGLPALDAAELSARAFVRSSPSRRPMRSGVRRRGRATDRLIAAGLDALDDGAVGRAESQRRGSGLRQDLAAMLFDRLGERLAVGDLEAPVMDAGAGAGEHGALAIVAVPLHQRNIEIAVGQMAGDVIAMLGGAAHLEAEHGLIERGGFLDIGYLQGQMHDARLGAALAQLEPPDIDQLRHAAVGRAELERAFLLVGEDRAAALLDRAAHGIAILDLDAEVMNAGPGSGELRLRLVLAVVGHQREIDGAFSHMARGVAARMAGLELVDTEDVLVELGGLFQVLDLERDVDDAGLGNTSLTTR